jgi:hypothetical protein
LSRDMAGMYEYSVIASEAKQSQSSIKYGIPYGMPHDATPRKYGGLHIVPREACPKGTKRNNSNFHHIRSKHAHTTQ